MKVLIADDHAMMRSALAGAVVEADDCWAPDTETETLFYGGAVEPGARRRVAERAPTDQGGQRP